MESNAKILEGIILFYFFVHNSEKALSSFNPHPNCDLEPVLFK